MTLLVDLPPEIESRVSEAAETDPVAYVSQTMARVSHFLPLPRL